MPVPTALSFRREGDAAVGDAALSPPRDDTSTDISRVSMSLPMVAMIVGTAIGTALTMSGAQYIAQASQRSAMAQLASDIRDIRTQLEGQKENLDLKFANIKLEVQNSELRKALLAELKANTK